MEFLATPETRQMLDQIKGETKESNGDLLERWVKAEWVKLFSGQESTK